MDFLDPVKKRAHNRRLFIGYFLVGIAILMASLIVVFLSYGYDINHKTGEVIQNGLIFADTAPESATIYLNGKENGSTSKRLTVPAGSYDVEFKRTGYRTWKKTIQLEGSSIERLVYARLFPTKLNTVESTTYASAPTFSTQSLDRRWIVVAQPGSVLDYQVFDTANPDTQPVSLQIPQSLLSPITSEAQSISPVEWSTDNRHFVVKHTYGDKFEFIVIDREQPSSSLNINKLLSVDPSDVSLRDQKSDQLYLYDATALTLATADTKTKQVTQLLTNVTAYKSYGSNILMYATKDPEAPGKTSVKLWDDTKIYTLHTYDDDTPVLLNLARFDSAWYMIVVPVKEGKMYIYKDAYNKLKADKPTTPTPYALMKIANPTKARFSTNTRFIEVQGSNHFAVYDFDTDRRFSYNVPGQLTADQTATWMDGNRLLLNQDGKVVVFEFDNANRQTLNTILPGSLPYFDRDYTRLFTLAPATSDATKIALTRTSLKLNLKP